MIERNIHKIDVCSVGRQGIHPLDGKDWQRTCPTSYAYGVLPENDGS